MLYSYNKVDQRKKVSNIMKYTCNILVIKKKNPHIYGPCGSNVLFKGQLYKHIYFETIFLDQFQVCRKIVTMMQSVPIPGPSLPYDCS